MHSSGPRNQAGRALCPRSIAIVGVSPEAGSIGGGVLNNLERFNYGGAIHLVSRNRSTIDGRPCVGSVADLPEGIDVAVLAVPGAGIREAVAVCADRKVGTAMVFAAGFAETGAAGQAEQEAIAQIARDGGMGLIGPNCIGLVNYRDGIPLTYEPIEPLEVGNAPAVGVVAQSGAMLSSLRMALLAKGLRLSHIVSTGNEAGFAAEDFLEFLVEDAATRAIVVFAEQIRFPRRFLAIAGEARARAKPIVLMHPGRSGRAAESARTHTGALAGDYAVMATLVRRHAVLLVETTEELIDTAEILVRFPRPPQAGAALITNSGAFKGFALDFCDALGLDLPKPTAATLAALAGALPPFAAIDNPLDTTGQTIKEPRIFTDAAAHLLADPGMGSLLVSIVPGGPSQAVAKAAALVPPLTATDKPVAVAVMGDEGPLPKEFVPAFRNNGVPVFRSPERALRALAHATAYGRQLADFGTANTDIAQPDVPLLGAIPEYLGKSVLAELEIPVPPGELAMTFSEAQKIAGRIGYPVVIKAQSALLTHKSDIGGVIVGIDDRHALSAAWERLSNDVAQAEPKLELDGVLIETMAAPGIEMMVGGRRDPAWGPVVMVGLGGIWVEALGDVRLMAADLSAAAIAAEIAQLKAHRLLAGLRGRPPADIDALVTVVQKIGALLRGRPEVTEIDINPLMVYPKGQGVLALDVLVVTKTAG
jgi:acyl-CoA synthetase (NDP forming)